MYIYYITSVVYPHDTGIWMSHLSLFLFVLLLLLFLRFWLFVGVLLLFSCCCSVVVVVVCFCPTSPSSVSSYSCSSACPIPLCPKIALIYNTIQYNFIAKCQYTDCTRNVLWCQVHSSHSHSNHKTFNYNNSK